MKTFLMAAVALAASACATVAEAATFVGSWRVDQGPNWATVPAALSGQQAAALLFGGNASDYSISTVDANAANINNKAWVSVWFASSFPDCPTGFPCGRIVDEDSVTSTGGLYANPGDTSAYVQDWAVGPEFVNYAFIDARIPEPGTWALLITGFGMVGATMRRRRPALAA